MNTGQASHPERKPARIRQRTRFRIGTTISSASTKKDKIQPSRHEENEFLTIASPKEPESLASQEDQADLLLQRESQQGVKKMPANTDSTIPSEMKAAPIKSIAR